MGEVPLDLIGQFARLWVADQTRSGATKRGLPLGEPFLYLRMAYNKGQRSYPHGRFIVPPAGLPAIERSEARSML